MYPKFEVFKSVTNNQYYFRLRASNAEPILSSEGYTSRGSCLNGIASVRTNAPLDNRYDRKNTNGSYTFNLKSSNGEIIGRSESYVSQAGRELGIASVKKDAPDAPIHDMTDSFSQ